MSAITVRDPADTFAYVMDWLLRNGEPARAQLTQWRKGRQVDIATLGRSIVALGEIAVADLDVALQAPENAFVLLCAIDEAFGYLSPEHGADPGRMRRFSRRLRKIESLNENIELGLVLPRRAFPTRPQPVPDDLSLHMRSLIIVGGRSSHKVHFSRLHPSLDFSQAALDGGVERIKVACLPFIANQAELDISRKEESGALWYAIQPDMSDESRWRERVATALAELDHSEAHIGLVPESALTVGILALWVDEIRRSEPPANSRLQWILVGTGPFPAPRGGQPANRAILLSRNTGKQVSFQDKCEPFTLDDDQIQRWGLGQHLGDGPLAEWMKEGRDRFVIDTSVCRLAILVCEDEGRLLTVGAELVDYAPTLLLVPILAPPIMLYRWQHNAAEQFVNTTGSSTVVATSNALRPELKFTQTELELPPSGSPRRRLQQWGTSLMLRPRWNEPASAWGSASVVTSLLDAGREPSAWTSFELPRAPDI